MEMGKFGVEDLEDLGGGFQPLEFASSGGSIDKFGRFKVHGCQGAKRRSPLSALSIFRLKGPLSIYNLTSTSVFSSTESLHVFGHREKGWALKLCDIRKNLPANNWQNSFNSWWQNLTHRSPLLFRVPPQTLGFKLTTAGHHFTASSSRNLWPDGTKLLGYIRIACGMLSTGYWIKGIALKPTVSLYLEQQSFPLTIWWFDSPVHCFLYCFGVTWKRKARIEGSHGMQDTLAYIWCFSVQTEYFLMEAGSSLDAVMTAQVCNAMETNGICELTSTSPSHYWHRQ